MNGECKYEILGNLTTYVAEARENCPTVSEEEAGVSFHVPVLRPEARRDLGSLSGSRQPLRVSRSPDSCRRAETNTKLVFSDVPVPRRFVVSRILNGFASGDFYSKTRHFVHSKRTR